MASNKPQLAFNVRGLSTRSAKREQPSLDVLLGQVLELMQVGLTDGALRILATASSSAQRSDTACTAFALIYLGANRYQDAIHWFNRALGLRKNYPEALAGKGLALQSLGRARQAIHCYDLSLAIRQDDPETLYNRGVVFQAIGEVESALASYDAALAQRPTYLFALMKRCATLETLGRLQEALAGFDAIFAVEPDCSDAWCNRGNVLQKLGRSIETVACYDKALLARQNFPAALTNRAIALKELQRLPEALRDVTAALGIAPDQPETLILRGNILHTLEREDEAERDFRQALAIQPLISHPAIKSPAEFAALFLFSPRAGNTLDEDLISSSGYDSNVLMLLSGAEYDAHFLKRRTDVVVNLLSDVDSGSEQLQQAEHLVDRVGKPVVNHPCKVLLTGREQVSQTLARIPRCCVPATRRYSGAALVEAVSSDSLANAFPVVARVTGTHGGDRMERIDTSPKLAQFIEVCRGSDFYISGYVDYRSPDGFFRKYRFMYVGDEILPYHLAIGEEWKVHHVSTNMGDHPWMQAEEQRFLEEPQSAFCSQAYETLHAIRAAIGLDYFGIDCALDQDGSVVVFEVNASMLVHLRNERFPYKNNAVLRIKSAFASMLRRKIESRSHG